MKNMPRKNIHMPDEVVRLIGNVFHNARFRSETQAVIAMLEGASDRLSDVSGYVYLARGEKGLKIGVSIQPHYCAKVLKSDLLFCIAGDRLTELAAHMIWGRYRNSGEWFEDRPEICDWFENHPMREDLGSVIDAKSFSADPNQPWPEAMTDSEKHELQLAEHTKKAAVEQYNATIQRLKNRCIQRLRRKGNG